MTVPRIAVFTGDPAGIGPELVAQLLADAERCACANIVLIGQKKNFPIPAAVKWHEWPGLHADEFETAKAQASNGQFMLEGLAQGAQLARSGQVDAFCFAPLNKGALRAGGMHQEDELRWFAENLNHSGVCGELNVLDGLWTARVTSHVPLSQVSALISPE